LKEALVSYIASSTAKPWTYYSSSSSNGNAWNNMLMRKKYHPNGLGDVLDNGGNTALNDNVSGGAKFCAHASVEGRVFGSLLSSSFIFKI